MKTNHTPGPWTVDESRDCRSKGYIRAENRVAVARATSAGRGHSELLANARLIAAAPELLLMLKALLEKNHGKMGADEFEKAFGFPIQETRSRVEDLIDKTQ